MPISRESVIWGYRFILGREPESEQAITDHLNVPDLDALRSALLSSREFRASVAVLHGPTDGSGAERRDDPRPLLLFVGNCQAPRLARMSARLCADIQTDAIEVVRTHAIPRLEDHLPSILAQAARAHTLYIQPYVLDLLREHGVDRPAHCQVTESLVFDAFHPDIVFAYHQGTGAPLHGAMGQYQSAIALWAFQQGLGLEETLALYRPEVLSALGYGDFWDTALKRLESVDETCGTALVNWARGQKGRSVFMHSINHPAKDLLAEYAAQLLTQAGWSVCRDSERYATDEFLSGPVWPVYPPIADRLGVTGSYRFKSPDAVNPSGTIRVHDLAGFVTESFALYHRHRGALRYERLEHPPFTTLHRHLTATRVTSTPTTSTPAPRATAALAERQTPGAADQPARARSQTPYQHLPDSQFWSRSIARVGPADVDLVVNRPRLISPRTRVASAGSCFAQHIARALRESGQCYFVTEDGADLDRSEATRRQYGTFSARYGNLYTARQLVQLIDRAYGRWEPTEPWWTLPSGAVIDPFRPTVEPEGFASAEAAQADRQRHLAAVHTLFEQLDVFIYTLGLTETWRCRADGAVLPVVPGAQGGVFDAERYEFVNFTYEDVVADLHTFQAQLAAINPRARVIYTVSPVPLVASYSGEHVAVASSASKAILRAAVQSVVSAHANSVYFPSFEIITGSWTRGRYFGADARSVTEEGVAQVMRTFRHHLLEEPPPTTALGELQDIGAVLCDEELLDADAHSDHLVDRSLPPLIVHLHVQKTGGSSVNELLAAAYGAERSRTGTGEDLSALTEASALSIDCFFGHVHADQLPRLQRPLQAIVFLRAPWDRLQSTYRYLRALDPAGPEGHALVHKAHASDDLIAFLSDAFVHDSLEIWNHQTWCVVGERQWRAWKERMGHLTPADLEDFLDREVRPVLQARVRALYFIGRFAHFDADVARLLTRLGHPTPTLIPVRNSLQEARRRNRTAASDRSDDAALPPSVGPDHPLVRDACRLDELLVRIAG